jgi:hypothetical protein
MKFHIFQFFVFFISILASQLIAQTNEQLRDPEFLVDQYNQLVLKHNALIEKTRKLIDEKNSYPTISAIDDTKTREELNEANSKIELLESKIDKPSTTGTKIKCRSRIP